LRRRSARENEFALIRSIAEADELLLDPTQFAGDIVCGQPPRASVRPLHSQRNGTGERSDTELSVESAVCKRPLTLARTLQKGICLAGLVPIGNHGRGTRGIVGGPVDAASG